MDHIAAAKAGYRNAYAHFERAYADERWNDALAHFEEYVIHYRERLEFLILLNPQ